jgi:putative transposase
MARLASAERAGSSISRFYDNCKKGNPQFQKNCRSVEYKSTGWKLASDPKSINFTDKKGIGRLTLKGTRDLNFYSLGQIKRVRLVKPADGVYVQFCIDVDKQENTQPSGNIVVLKKVRYAHGGHGGHGGLCPVVPHMRDRKAIPSA